MTPDNQPTEEITTNPQPETPTQPPAAAQPAAPIPTDKNDPKSRLAMMAIAFFGGPTGIARAYIGDSSGLVRLWLYIGSTVLSVIPFINIIAALIIVVLGIWGIIDFFLLHKAKTDHFGNPLYATARDNRYIKYLYRVFIALLIAGAALILLAIVFMIFAVMLGGGMMTEMYGSPYEFDINSSDLQDRLQGI